VEASRRVNELVRLGPPVLLDVLTAFDGADPVAANWLRAVVDTIAEHALAEQQSLPTAALEAFVKSTRHDGAARHLAYQWLARIDSTAPERLLPAMLNDPGQELRRAAVNAVLMENNPEALRKAFNAACDIDQVVQLARKLADRGVSVDVPAHLGFVQRWQLSGPFDNGGGRGFAVAYPPEARSDLGAHYLGMNGSRFGWKDVSLIDTPGKLDLSKMAKVDINAILGKHTGAVAYAFAAIASPRAQLVEVRVGTPNALKLFLNGKEICSREEYHHNGRLDTHIARGVLKSGRNELVVKLCQNEQSDAWAQEWAFQLRICDAIGGAVPFTVPPMSAVMAEPVARAHGSRSARNRWWLLGGLLAATLLGICCVRARSYRRASMNHG
jgi:hypothetical protein